MRNPSLLKVSEKSENLKKLDHISKPTSDILRDVDSNDSSRCSCECDTRMVASAPSKEEYSTIVTKLNPGVEIELYWCAMKRWYKGVITETRKGNEFIRVLCQLGKEAYDHIWYHTVHTKIRNIKKLANQ